MEFTAIDFETANEQPSSACQLGAVVVRDGQIVAKHNWLIRPRPARFSMGNIRIHGITPEMVRGEPEFGELWSDIATALGSSVLVAHNALFDIGVLRATLSVHGRQIPDIQFTCTRAIARQAWPREQGYGLRAIADRLGITFQHHDALEDAEACAKVLLEAAAVCKVSGLVELEKKLCMSRGRAGAWGAGGPRLTSSRSQWGSSGGRYWNSGRRSSTATGSGTVRRDLQPHLDFGTTARGRGEWLRDLLEFAAKRRPLKGHVVVLTGILERLEREEAEHLVARAGGEVASSVTKRTTMVVLGQLDDRTRAAGRDKSTKQERAEQLRETGQVIALDSEEAFLARFVREQNKQQALADAEQANDATNTSVVGFRVRGTRHHE